MKIDAIAVLDIGKTNKKVLIYNKQLEILDKSTKAFGEITDDNGLVLEQTEEVYAWFIETLKSFSGTYNIKAISVTTHGCMVIGVDDNGKMTCPPVAYTNQPGQEFCDSFYEEFGDRKTLQKQTGTAEIGEMINTAKMLYFLKLNYAAELEKTSQFIFYPQYFGYMLTGTAVSDHTMLGCHTYLYDHASKGYSDVATKLGLADKLPPRICNSWDSLGTVTDEIAEQTGLPTDCVVAAGVHDSNSSLVPFLITETEEFILNSTGTWCVAMKPTDNFNYKDDELGKTIFFNQDVFGNPVKTSIFMGGLEYETYTQILEDLHGRNDLPDFDLALYKKIIEDSEDFILPSVVKGAGLFPTAKPALVDAEKTVSMGDFKAGKAKPAFADNYELSMAILVTSLTLQTCCALDAAGYVDGGNIFVEGGFRHNQPYLELLTSLYPKSKVFKTNINEATALGSAILALSALENKSPNEIDVDLGVEKQQVPSVEPLNIESYKKAFLENIAKNS